MNTQLTNSNIESAFNDDRLNRKFLAENLKRILLNTDYNVFSVNAPWGGGKSYFIDNLSELIGDDAVCISYNVWESDFYNNPLVPLVIEIISQLDEIISKEDEVHKDLVNIINIVNDILKKLTFNAEIGDTFKHFIGNLGINYDPNKKTVESDYIELKALKTKLRQGLEFIQKRLNKNIIIFVDDLDRCNPKYAIETLEAIKHFFGIKNIIFVLAVDKKQVENIVKTIYGVCEGTSDVEGYLKKFIDVEFNLPAPAYKDFMGFQLQQIVDCSAPFIETNRWYNYGEIINGNIIKGKPYNGILVDTVERLVTTLNLTPRAIEKLFMRVKLTIESLSKDDFLLIEVVFFLNALYICDKKAFDIYVNSAPYNADLGQLGKMVEYIYPYWTGVLNNFGIILSSNRRNTSIELLSKEHNAVNLINTVHETGVLFQIKRRFDLDKYLKTYASKIEFIGSMD